MEMIGRQIVGDGVLNVMVDFTPYTVSKSHPNYAALRVAFNEKDAVKFLQNYNVVNTVASSLTGKVTSNRITVDGSGVYLDGDPIHNTVTTAILKMARNGDDFSPMVKFLERLVLNPSNRAVNELWGFLEQNGLILTEDGCFLAYKSVQSDYLDKYSGKFDNKPGAKMRMDRNKVDDNFQNHCSTGFHVGALAYSGPTGWYHSSGDKVVICKVAPEDVVSVPADHNCQKLRTCAYEVVGDYKAPLNAPVYSGNVGDDYDTKTIVADEADYVEEIDAHDMLVGHEYQFTYENSDGDEAVRTGVLHDNDDVDTYVFYMSREDKSAGNYRSFKTDYIYDVVEVERVAGKVQAKF